jgi:hypothetical protein
MPQQGSAAGLMHYIERGKELGVQVGVETPLVDCLLEIFQRAVPQIGERDVAAMIEAFEPQQQNRPRAMKTE